MGDRTTCLEAIWRTGSHTSSSPSLVFQICSQIYEECNLAATRYGLHGELVAIFSCKGINILEVYYPLRMKLSVFFSTFRYKPGQVFLEKDIILPYVPNVELCDAKCLSDSYSKRTTLLFFRGRLKRNAVRFCYH